VLRRSRLSGNSPFAAIHLPPNPGTKRFRPRCVGVELLNLGETAMDWNRVEGNWKQFKGKVREKWAELTDDDLARMDGKREQFEGVLQERYGQGRDRIREEVDTWLKTLNS
jgi:uncharacterized protein YjbJ (UPF0337 family)